MIKKLGIFCFLCLAAWTASNAQAVHIPIAFDKKSDSLKYTPDERGNWVPDFSYCGYSAGNDTLPNVPVRIVVPVQKGDATAAIQAALNYVASLPKDQNGFRGTLLLEKGTYKVEGRLKIDSSGVVLRGSGMGEKGTRLIAAGESRATLIRVSGVRDVETNTPVEIIDAYVPVGAVKFHVKNAKGIKVGDQVRIQRPCTQEWIDRMSMNNFGGQSGWLGWKPGAEVIQWERKVRAVRGNKITLNIGLTTALDSAYGGGTVSVYHWPGRISKVGIENLQLISEYDTSNPKDEAHCWMAVTLENVQDAWVRQVVFEHFAGSAVYALNTSRRITVEDCKSLAPVSEIGGERRYTFRTDGQQTLFQRLYSEYGYHDFAVGFMAAGPNAFVQCKAHLPYSFSGPVNSWASGVLFDNVRIDGGALRLKDLGQYNHGAGWNAANSMLWQCDAAQIDCYKPPTAQNWAIGCWAQPAGHGYWGYANEHVSPFSLYYGQLSNRLQKDVSGRARLLQIKTNPTSSPTVAQAAELTVLAGNPGPLLSDWIDRAAVTTPIPIQHKGVKTIDQVEYKKTSTPVKKAPRMQVKNGWLVRGNTILTGKRTEVNWWRGDVQPNEVKKAAPGVTRFVPGRTGLGLTDNLDSVTRWMKRNQVIALEQNYGLWYDRRRDDHERIRRMNGNVWPPFYVLPFARSGKGLAWDGLSKYDLTKYNPWYWNRLRKFASFADQKGEVLIHKNYFQHNIIEAGAHWVDFPWRTANNINHTGFPEPPPFAGDKRIFMAKQFYDTSNAVRRKLHIAYIQKCLENFKDNNSVIQLTAAEFTGPLHFMQFWVDVVKRWEQRTGIKECIGLSATKDVQDAILEDPGRSAVINLIDIRQWHYEKDSSLYAPKGGKSLAPRQWARLLRPRGSSFGQVYRAVREYREKYPAKAVIYSYRNYESYGWAVFMAGGSLASIPEISNPQFLKDAISMKPMDLVRSFEGQLLLGNPDKGYIIYNASGKPVHLNLKKTSGRFFVYTLNPVNGTVSKKTKTIRGGNVVTLGSTGEGKEVIWLSRKH